MCFWLTAAAFTPRRRSSTQPTILTALAHMEPLGRVASYALGTSVMIGTRPAGDQANADSATHL